MKDGRTEEDHSRQRVSNFGVPFLLGQFHRDLAERERPAGAVVRRAGGVPAGQGAPPPPRLRVPVSPHGVLAAVSVGRGHRWAPGGSPPPSPSASRYPVAAGSPTCGTPSPRVCRPLGRGTRSLSTTRCRPQGVCGEAGGGGGERRASSEQGAASGGTQQPCRATATDHSCHCGAARGDECHLDPPAGTSVVGGEARTVCRSPVRQGGSSCRQAAPPGLTLAVPPPPPGAQGPACADDPGLGAPRLRGG
ncbi:nascent polypeptide-associated complex subunit alpha, muscle-specific form-like [Physeter macrocephalus]|uniref:Nascent polypeptide-associated complex subunit alpha, muscle-specific form-like n=1 Tax=Physeter macrocephalus TaxID=9755 RepID=A0A455BK72_PHYMC|nr:nascent polypeptide-associated complex subunit alpha, muscle-specific form-like [Physeter catodon]|eukprot:XP_028348288.1 transcription initiation factor TFIID subunit 4-like [Physeter catodon]